MSETTTFGIDLGTTYSCISYLKDGHPTVCLNVEGDPTTPSVVRMLPEDDEPVVGKTAKETSVIYPDDTIQFVKAKIGKVAEFEIGAPDNKRSVTPVQVSAEILKKLASDAEKFTNMPVKDVVITVPAYFGNNEREATKQAGFDAGLNVIKIVDEPTAAAFFYLCERDDADATVCVYDLGGGTFDVSVIKKENGVITPITTEGDHDLGGKNWDAELMDLVIERFREATGLDDEEELDSDFLQELQIKCEQAKKQLSFSTQAPIALKLDKKHAANIIITRQDFDDRTFSLLQTSIDLTKKAFETCDERGIKIDKILLVGGSSKMPQVEAALNAEFGDKVDEILVNEPDESVSKGACIYCAWTLANFGTTAEAGGEAGEGSASTFEVAEKTTNDDGETVIRVVDKSTGEEHTTVIPCLPSKNLVVKTIATKSFGILSIVKGREMITNLIKKDTVLPVEVVRTFGTNTDNMRNVSIELYQSEIMDDAYEIDCGVMIGESSLTGIPENQPQGSPVDICISLTEEGVIVVTGAFGGQPLEGRLDTNFSEGVGKQ